MTATRYALTALERESDAVRESAQGERNNRLNQAAYCLGQLVAGGEIDRADVESALHAAALAAGLTADDAAPTIASGLRSGAKAPRTAPERDPATARRMDLPANQVEQPRPRSWSPEPDPPAPGAQWQQRATALVTWAAGQLAANPEPQSLLLARGISQDAARLAGLGHNPGEHGKDIFRARSVWGLPDETSPRTGKPKKLWVPRGLVIPMRHPDGSVLRVRIRRDEGEPRYYVLPGSSMAPLVLDNARRVTVVLESELDAILIQQEAGDLVNVVALGNSSRKPTATAHRLLQSTARIMCAFDCDDAGAAALAWWMDTYAHAAPLFVPSPHKDAGELAAAGYPIREWIADAMPQAIATVTATKAPVWTPPPANRHPEPAKTTPWNNTKPPERTPPKDPGPPDAPGARGEGSAPTVAERRAEAGERLRGLLRRCTTKKAYAAYNDQDGIGGRGCIQCGPGRTSCGLDYEIGALVCNDEWVQDYVLENGGTVRSNA